MTSVVSILHSMNRAIANHPVLVLTMWITPHDKLHELNEYTKAMTIVYMAHVHCDTENSLEWFPSLQLLELSSILPLVVFFCHGLEDTQCSDPILRPIEQRTIQTFQAATTLPFSYFDMYKYDAKPLDEFTNNMVGDVLSSRMAGHVE
jgi:hypothetical protein